MDGNLKLLWIKALRSGEYKQGNFKLKSFESFCCLGVACDLVTKINPDYCWRNDRLLYAGKVIASISLPQLIQKMFGLTDEIQTTLMGMNDTEKKSFDEIADYLCSLEGFKSLDFGGLEFAPYNDPESPFEL